MKDFKNYIISDDSTLIVACEAITKNKSRCVLIESKNKIIGIVSEGDIIRAFLMGADINSRVKDYTNLSFIFFDKKDLNKAKLIFKKKQITLIPILNDKMKIIDLITLNEILDLK
jgi:predicted transcriptional regulator